eukprot:9652190-Karenia_brevis.AAC.1
MGQSGRLTVIDHQGHRPVGVSHLYGWTHEHGKFFQEWKGAPCSASKTNQSKGLSHPGKGPGNHTG